MKNLIIVLNLLFVVFTMISCSNDTANNVSQQSDELVKEPENKNQLIEILNQPSIFNSLVEKFEVIESEEEYISFQNFILPSDNMSCTPKVDQELCQQILKIFNENELSFSSDKESIIVEDFAEHYNTTQKGKITIGENTYDANLYFNSNYSDNQIRFYGKLVFNFPGISLLAGRPIVIDIKGKK